MAGLGEYECVGCHGRFSERRKHSQHTWQCKKVGKNFSEVIKARRKREREEREAKREAKRRKLDEIAASPDDHPSNASDASDTSSVSAYHATNPDDFGLYRVYPVKPKRLPDPPPVERLCDPSAFAQAVAQRPRRSAPDVPTLRALDDDESGIPAYAPFKNYSSFALSYWQNNESNNKSNGQMDGLAKLMQHPEFNPADVAKFDAAREAQRLDSYYEDNPSSPFSARDGWKHGTIKLRVPKEGVAYASESCAPEFTVEGLYYRDIVDIVEGAYRSPDVKEWDIIPSKMFWLHDGGNDPPSRTPRASPSPAPSEASSSSSGSSSSSTTSSPENPFGGMRVYNECFHADAIWEDDAAMRERPREVGDPEDLEYAIAPLGLWSDSTHLTSFGSAKAWPVYAYVLSQSKYVRGRPSAYAAHHLAYIPSLPDSFQDWYTQIHKIAATAAVLTFLKRELMQGIYLLLMDERFMYAYVHGLLMLCGDGILRRLFIRFLLYAADYPEKILLACLKYFARCPCPRCRINKDKIIEMGTTNDLSRRNWIRMDNDDLNHRINLTRRWIFQEGMPLTSVYISRILDPLSATPTRSAFSTRLRDHGFNFYALFVPDLLHEFELGVWKSLFTHFLRLLHAAGNDTIQEFNKRFRQIPTYGRSTIRRFSANISDQGKLAARDYEARVKCVMPAIEALMPLAVDDDRVLDVAFDYAAWHALAKLREHTEFTVEGLEVFTIESGKSTRAFAKKTCTAYATIELPKEAAARGRRTVARTGSASTIRKRKNFNYATYKFHAMGDYAAAIRAYGTTDNYSTQIGELEHKHVKRYYVRTNKHKFTFQIARHVRREEKLRIIKARVAARDARRDEALSHSTPERQLGESPATSLSAAAGEGRSPSPEPPSPAERYHLADSQRDSVELTAWLRTHPQDPALVDFIVKLKDHILARRSYARGEDPPSSKFSAADRARVVIVNNKVYWHRVLRINYTTYDRQRAQDSINPRTHADILLLSPAGSAHEFMYARVLKILHVNARVVGEHVHGESPERYDILFVRWMQLDPTHQGGFAAKRLHRLEFVPVASLDDDPDAFGFVNPYDVVRAAHLIPCFARGRTSDRLGPSPVARSGAGAVDVARDDEELRDTDWCYYYVGMFVDRDMFMRYYHGGIGHQGLREPSAVALDDEEFDAVWRDEDFDLDVNIHPVLDPQEDAVEAANDRDASGEEARTEDDLMRLVPELALGLREAVAEAAAEEIGILEGEGQSDSEDESSGDDEAEDESEDVLSRDPGAVEDRDRLEDLESDEYEQEGFAPL
ncbi:hypothetical protein C8Q73DRAFT_773146 [Cubamyces lactineus]|nr:hypothetical protein C8Q73DRAFT_773146 [Cubamyces lactineus]